MIRIFSPAIDRNATRLYLSFYLAPILSPWNAHDFEVTFELSNHFPLFLSIPGSYFYFYHIDQFLLSISKEREAFREGEKSLFIVIFSIHQLPPCILIILILKISLYIFTITKSLVYIYIYYNFLIYCWTFSLIFTKARNKFYNNEYILSCFSSFSLSRSLIFWAH